MAFINDYIYFELDLIDVQLDFLLILFFKRQTFSCSSHDL